MFDKALKYLENNRPEKAIPLFKKLLKDTEYKEILLNLGTCYRLQGNDEKAAECYIRANDSTVPMTDNTFSPVYPMALNNLGLLAYTYENDVEAEILFNEALKYDPTYPDALWNLGNCKLRQYCSNKYSRLDLCWDLYEYRIKRSSNPVRFKSKKTVQTWDGRPIDSLVVMTEQGFGDQLMFARYLKLLESRVDRIVVQCHDRIKPLYNYETCSDVPAEIDVGIGLCSLGKIFNDAIPPGEWLNDKYTSKCKNGVLDIGVTWSGNTSHVNDRYRSTTPNYFRSLASFGNLYTLNPTEANTSGFTTLDSSGWIATIRELSKLDLVITVDTSIAHLCGSLGMPCWVLMPLKNGDFRWGDSSMGYNNVWYPSVRVFRNPGSWDVVFENVKNELKKL